MAVSWAGSAARIIVLLLTASSLGSVLAAQQAPGAYDKAKESAREYFGTPSTTDNVKAGAADAYAKAKDLASDASQAAYDATREPTTFEKAKGYMSPPSTADKAKAQASDAYATAKDYASQAGQAASETYDHATRQPTVFEKIKGYFSPPTTAERTGAAAASAYATGKAKAGQAFDSASKAAYDATREPTAYEKAKGYMSPPSTADKIKAGAADAYAQAKDKASDAYDAASHAAHEATRDPTAFEKAKGYMSPPSTADRVKAGAADAYADAKDKASQAYDSTTQAAHDATREPTTFEKAKGYMSPPSTADKVKAGAADAYANAKGKASEAYDSAAGAAHEATRGPTTYEKVKDRFTPSTADKAKAKTNSAYGTAKDKANKAYDSAAGAAHEATRQPTAFEKAKGYLSPPSTADKVKGKASEAYGSAAGAAHEATRGPTTYEKVKDRLTPSTADRVKGSANEAYANAKGKANEAYDSAAGAAHEATREPTAYEQAKGYVSPPSTADNIRGGAEDTAAAASARFQSVKDRIAAVGQPQQKSYFQQAKDYFKKSPSQQAQDYASDTYNAAGSKAQGAYDSVKGAASDASARAGDASGRAQRNAKGTQQAAAGKAGQAYNAAADSANRASGKAGEYASKGKQAAGETYDQASGQVGSSVDSMRAALASYSDWLKDIKNDVTDSSSRSAQDAAAYSKDSARGTKQYSDSAYQEAKNLLADKLGQGRKTSDTLYERTQSNSRELWSALQDQYNAGSAADRKALAGEFKTAQTGHSEFGKWLSSAQASLTDSYNSATQSAEDTWAALKKNARKTADYLGDKAEL